MNKTSKTAAPRNAAQMATLRQFLVDWLASPLAVAGRVVSGCFGISVGLEAGGLLEIAAALVVGRDVRVSRRAMVDEGVAVAGLVRLVGLVGLAGVAVALTVPAGRISSFWPA